MPTFTSKLLALGLTTALGGAGAVFGGPAATSIIERPDAESASGPSSYAPSSYTIGQPPSEGAALPLPLDAVTLADPRVEAALRDPMVRAVLADPAVRSAVADIDPAVLGRPGVIDAIRSGEIDPTLAADPVVLANLPAILSAVPVIRAAVDRIGPTRNAVPRIDTIDEEPDDEIEASTGDDAPAPNDATLGQRGERGRSAHAHAARDARQAANEARRDARRAILRDGRPAAGEAPRGLSASQRADLRAIGSNGGGRGPAGAR